MNVVIQRMEACCMCPPTRREGAVAGIGGARNGELSNST